MAQRLVDEIFDALDEQTVVVPGTGTLDSRSPVFVTGRLTHTRTCIGRATYRGFGSVNRWTGVQDPDDSPWPARQRMAEVGRPTPVMVASGRKTARTPPTAPVQPAQTKGAARRPRLPAGPARFIP